MKGTALQAEHEKLGAKMVPFAGWIMPLQYRGIVQEHFVVRNYAGLFDVSHMGEFFAEGKEAAAFLNSVVPQDVENMPENKVVYCQLTNDKGGIIDDLLIYKISTEKFLLIVNASRINIDFQSLKNSSKNFDVNLKNLSDEYSLIAIQGPNASAVMGKAGLSKENQPEFMHFMTAKIYDVELFISRTGYTGEDGFELLMKNNEAVKIWKNLLEDGKEFKIEPIGLGARDTLRLEAALPLYGLDIDENTTPVEAGLKWSVPKDKTADYPGKNNILKQIKDGTEKKLIGFQLIERGIARHGDKVLLNGKPLGVVTSGTMSPISKISFGLAYIDDTSLKIDNELQIEIRGKQHLAKIVKTPFMKKAYAK